MSALSAAVLPSRGLLRVSGEDRVPFLQGLLTNDVRRLAPDRGLFAALLTPQGKMQFDLFLSPAPDGDAELLDAESDRLADLRTRLMRFKLRSKLTLAPLEDWRVVALWGEGVAEALGLPDTPGAARTWEEGGAHAAALMDPRLPAAGARLMGPADRLDAVLAGLGAETVGWDAWEAHRLRLGLPDGSRDMVIEKSTALECGLEELSGVDFRKGCYMGQELTARTKYRGLLKRRLMPVRIDGPLPEPGTALMTEAGKAAGEMRSGLTLGESGQGLGMAIVRLEALDEPAPLTCGDARLRPVVPDWMVLPAREDAAVE